LFASVSKPTWVLPANTHVAKIAMAANKKPRRRGCAGLVKLGSSARTGRSGSAARVKLVRRRFPPRAAFHAARSKGPASIEATAEAAYGLPLGVT